MNAIDTAFVGFDLRSAELFSMEEIGAAKDFKKNVEYDQFRQFEVSYDKLLN